MAREKCREQSIYNGQKERSPQQLRQKGNQAGSEDVGEGKNVPTKRLEYGS